MMDWGIRRELSFQWDLPIHVTCISTSPVMSGGPGPKWPQRALKSMPWNPSQKVSP